MPHLLQQTACQSSSDRGVPLSPLSEGQVLESMSGIDPDILKRSEFVEPSGQAAQALYVRLLASLEKP